MLMMVEKLSKEKFIILMGTLCIMFIFIMVLVWDDIWQLRIVTLGVMVLATYFVFLLEKNKVVL